MTAWHRAHHGHGMCTCSRLCACSVICNTNPYSVCKNGVCGTSSTPAPTNKWVTSNPSTCSCAGQQTLNVQCQDTAGNVLPSAQCTGTPPASTQACTPPTTCAAWKTTAFGTCSNNCGIGVQSRTVTCVLTSTAASPVDDSLCSKTPKPASSQACPNQPACPTAWVASGFTSCTKSCDSGIQTQTVTCMQTQNGVKSTVVASACTATKPATQQACNTNACVDGIGWTYGVWSACSVTVRMAAHIIRCAFAPIRSSCSLSTARVLLCRCLISAVAALKLVLRSVRRMASKSRPLNAHRFNRRPSPHKRAIQKGVQSECGERVNSVHVRSRADQVFKRYVRAAFRTVHT
jgi:hypothetical protein